MTGSPARAAAIAAALAAALLATVAPARAQLATTPASHLGLAENGLAVARGWEASALNPANLGLADQPPFSLSLLGTSVFDGLDPVGFVDLTNFSGERVPAATKGRWLTRIESAGRQAGAGSVEVALLSLSYGPFALQASTVGLAAASLDPHGAELILFGTSGRTGDPQSLAPADARFDLFTYSTVALSFGYRIVPDGVLPFGEASRLSVGATIKYTAGHDVVVARDAGSASVGAPAGASILLPAIQTPRDAGLLDSGSGPGLDVGLAWSSGPLVLSVTGRNAVNLFRWDVDRLAYRPNRIELTPTQSRSALDEEPITAAPPALVEMVDGLRFAPEIGAGVAWRMFGPLQLVVDYRRHLRDGMAVAPEQHVGGGVELTTPIPLLTRIRAGGAVVTGGFQAGGGMTLGWGALALAGSFLYREADGRAGALASVSLSLGGR